MIIKYLIVCLIFVFPSFAQVLSHKDKTSVNALVHKMQRDFAVKNNLREDFLRVKSVNLVPTTDKKQWRIFVIWGYNRSWHAPSDATFSNLNGKFTIHKAKAKDRPTPFSWDGYFGIKNITIPQYNLRIGAEKKISSKGTIGVEIGTDHMKWVFERFNNYEITGDYDSEIYKYQDGKVLSVDFQEIKNSGDASFVAFEYTDGHNYVHLNTFYNFEVLNLFKNRLVMSVGVEGGVGAYVPKPHMRLLNPQTGQMEGLNGRFQLAGYGGHIGARTRLTFFDRVFIESSLRSIAIKNKSKIYSPEEFTIEHNHMGSTQFYAGLGVMVRISGN